MMRIGKSARRVLLSAGAVAVLYVGSPAIEEAFESTPAAQIIRLVSADRAEAQWGVNRRVARRTARRVTRRYLYSLPVAYTTRVIAGVRYYYANGECYEAVMHSGEVVYIVVDCD